MKNVWKSKVQFIKLKRKKFKFCEVLGLEIGSCFVKLISGDKYEDAANQSLTVKLDLSFLHAVSFQHAVSLRWLEVCVITIALTWTVKHSHVLFEELW